jgi:TonB-dependent receptor
MFGIFIKETVQISSNYTGDQDISAIYGMLDFPIFDRLRFIGGVRYETTKMIVESENPDKPIGEVNTDDILPSANMIYALNEKMNVRLAFGRTLARPTFREISSFTSYDFKGGDQYLGNPDLERTLINNLDLRFEWFPSPGEIFAFSGFYKKFKNPIEQVIIDINYWIQWQNVDEAMTAGMEFEMRKRLDFIGSPFRHFTFNGNLSLIHSRVDIAEDELAIIRLMDPDAKDHRTFQGQSPYILNLSLSYDHFENGISSTIYFNLFGERLAAIGRGGTPDIYEQPAGLLNFSLSKKFGHFSVKFAGKNLLDSQEKKLHEFKGQEFVSNLYQRGRVFSIGFKYDL